MMGSPLGSHVHVDDGLRWNDHDGRLYGPPTASLVEAFAPDVGDHSEDKEDDQWNEGIGCID